MRAGVSRARVTPARTMHHVVTRQYAQFSRQVTVLRDAHAGCRTKRCLPKAPHAHVSHIAARRSIATQASANIAANRWRGHEAVASPPAGRGSGNKACSQVKRGRRPRRGIVNAFTGQHGAIQRTPARRLTSSRRCSPQLRAFACCAFRRGRMYRVHSPARNRRRRISRLTSVRAPRHAGARRVVRLQFLHRHERQHRASAGLRQLRTNAS